MFAPNVGIFGCPRNYLPIIWSLTGAERRALNLTIFYLYPNLNTAPMAADTPTPPRSLLSLLKDFNTPWKMKLYFLRKLPSCWFWGVRVVKVDQDKGVVSIPYSWRTQNPFRSIYFAALCGAAELSTGLLGVASLPGQGKVSMLITGLEARFVKKADSRTTFTCTQGAALREAVQRALETGEGQEVVVTSTGRNEAGEAVCELQLTWSFKKKR